MNNLEELVEILEKLKIELKIVNNHKYINDLTRSYQKMERDLFKTTSHLDIEKKHLDKILYEITQIDQFLNNLKGAGTLKSLFTGRKKTQFVEDLEKIKTKKQKKEDNIKMLTTKQTLLEDALAETEEKLMLFLGVNVRISDITQMMGKVSSKEEIEKSISINEEKIEHIKKERTR